MRLNEVSMARDVWTLRTLQKGVTVVTVFTSSLSVYLAKPQTEISADGTASAPVTSREATLVTFLPASHDPPCVGHALSLVTQ